MRTCFIERCLGKHYGLGLCKKHYSARYHEAHQEEIRSKKAEYRRTHREEMAEYRRAHREEMARYYQEHKEEIINYRREHKEERANLDVKRKYGITPTQYQEALEKQDNRCAVCGSLTSKNKRYTRFCIDHEHVEGYKKMPAKEKMKYFRGLLCHNCNCMLKEGYEDIKTLQKYVGYLRNPPAKELNLKYTKSKVQKLRGVLISKFEDKCWIDSNHNSGPYSKLSVDHNHTTKDVRGLLCKDCNDVLGHTKDSIEIIENAIKYLKRYSVLDT